MEARKSNNADRVSNAGDGAVPSGNATPRTTPPEVSLLRLYALRLFYLVACGNGVYYWPEVFHHTDEFVVTGGIRTALLAGLGATAVLGLRYPLQMLFELTWKAIYFIAFAMPLWHAQKLGAAAEDAKACLMVVVFIPTVPWRYVGAHYIVKRGDRWK